ncbi:hypothetical protein NMY22_g14604 [Coprinellus aureogranulatus]|nr:hypothetical protein NMY22_g14604 [Coprinellus aureogranulatus]
MLHAKSFILAFVAALLGRAAAQDPVQICGGLSWNGPTVCPRGFVCTVINEEVQEDLSAGHPNSDQQSESQMADGCPRFALILLQRPRQPPPPPPGTPSTPVSSSSTERYIETSIRPCVSTARPLETVEVSNYQPRPIAPPPILQQKPTSSMPGAHEPCRPVGQKSPGEKAGLTSLPYDLLLNVASYLDLDDVHNLHLVCKSLHDFAQARPVYRKLATDLLRRCRALPLKGFQQITDLTPDQLMRSVNKATRYERAWGSRAPHPIRSPPRSNYMDGEYRSWYKVVSAPPDEDVDWLSPITSSYTLCATKRGKVVCWDVQRDLALAEWNPGEKWELWKCRVEFEQRTVYFTMAKLITGGYDDGRIMEFILMRLSFTDGPSGETSKVAPIFSHVTDFRTTGVVMNVFLLDPPRRLLSAFVWVSATNTIGLFTLPDWDKREYVFLDTGIEYPVVELVLHPLRRQHRHPLRRIRSSLPTLLPLILPKEVHKNPAYKNLRPRHVVCHPGHPQAGPTTLFNDNQGAIALSKDPQYRARTKHIQRKFHFVRDDLVRTGVVRIKYLPTEEMVADIMTKPLAREAHWKFVEAMGLRMRSSGSVKNRVP